MAIEGAQFSSTRSCLFSTISRCTGRPTNKDITAREGIINVYLQGNDIAHFGTRKYNDYLSDFCIPELGKGC